MTDAEKWIENYSPEDNRKQAAYDQLPHVKQARRDRNKKHRKTPLGKKQALAGARRSRWRARMACLQHYSGIEPQCACCGECELGFLTIDHINSDGSAHRKKSPKTAAGMYFWLQRNGFPTGFQILCFNCNMGREQNGGICPHTQTQTFETRCKSHRRIDQLSSGNNDSC